MDTHDQSRGEVTVLGADARFKGELTLEGTGRINGAFEGVIRAGEIQIGESGQCHASIEGGTIIIEGVHQGDLIARDCLQLASKANVQGDVTATALAVAQGATFIGRCVVGPDALANASRVGMLKPADGRKPTGPRPADWLEQAATPSTPAPDWLGQPAPTVSVRPWVTNPTAAA